MPEPTRAATSAPSTEDRPSSGAPEAALTRLAELVEGRIVPALERIASALEARPSPGPVEVPPELRRRAEAMAELRAAIAAGSWVRAADLVEDFGRAFPGDPEEAALRASLAQGRDAAITDLQARLRASRAVNDPQAVLALHDDLTVLLSGDARRDLEQDVVRWLIGLIQRRMRAGTVRPDVVDLATQVADRFGGTTEGASVRASLPTLRRSAGLCPRCGGPYDGFEAACPRCLVGEASAAPPGSTTVWDEADDPATDPDDPENPFA